MDKKERDTILIVDDQEVNRKILDRIFCEQFKIIEAEDGLEAIEKLNKNEDKIVLILLDIIMPLMDGFDVLHYMKTAGFENTIPVILITSDTSAETEKKGYEYRVADIINKPFNAMVIMRRITNILELYEQKRAIERLEHGDLQEKYQELQAKYKKLKQKNDDLMTLFRNFLLEQKANYNVHLIRLLKFINSIGQYVISEYPEYNLNKKELDKIVNAAVYYDIGKINIPRNILYKPAKLNKEEIKIVQTHTIEGVKILEELNCFKDSDIKKYALQICHFHHERYDGNGYPEKLKGDQIPIAAQIVSIAEVYAALLRKESYRDAFSQIKAEKMVISGECGVFNPKLIDCFILAKEEMRSIIINNGYKTL